MKNRQIRLIIGILVGLVLFSSSLAFLFYTKQGDVKAHDENSIEVFIATKHLAKGNMITHSDLGKSYLPQSYIAGVPLTEAEIIGRYASVDIFEKELFRKEKLSMLAPQKNEILPKVEEVAVEESKESQKSDTVALPLSLFQNIDTTLKSGDFIDIVSVIPKEIKTKNTKFETKYIALHVLIDSFISGSTKTQEVVSKDDKKLIYADSVVFEMKPNDIKNFFSTYYKTQELNANRVFNTSKNSRGHLWMVKCSASENEALKKTKDKLMVDHVTQRKRIVAKESVSISYEN